MLRNMPVRDAIKLCLKQAWYAKETGNREYYAINKEIIRRLWRHRHTDKPVSAIM